MFFIRVIIYLILNINKGMAMKNKINTDLNLSLEEKKDILTHIQNYIKDDPTITNNLEFKNYEIKLDKKLLDNLLENFKKYFESKSEAELMNNEELFEASKLNEEFKKVLILFNENNSNKEIKYEVLKSIIDGYIEEKKQKDHDQLCQSNYDLYNKKFHIEFQIKYEKQLNESTFKIESGNYKLVVNKKKLKKYLNSKKEKKKITEELDLINCKKEYLLNLNKELKELQEESEKSQKELKELQGKLQKILQKESNELQKKLQEELRKESKKESKELREELQKKLQGELTSIGIIKKTDKEIPDLETEILQLENKKKLKIKELEISQKECVKDILNLYENNILLNKSINSIKYKEFFEKLHLDRPDFDYKNDNVFLIEEDNKKYAEYLKGFKKSELKKVLEPKEVLEVEDIKWDELDIRYDKLVVGLLVLSIISALIGVACFCPFLGIPLIAGLSMLNTSIIGASFLTLAAIGCIMTCPNLKKDLSPYRVNIDCSIESNSNVNWGGL